MRKKSWKMIFADLSIILNFVFYFIKYRIKFSIRLSTLSFKWIFSVIIKLTKVTRTQSHSCEGLKKQRKTKCREYE